MHVTNDEDGAVMMGMWVWMDACCGRKAVLFVRLNNGKKLWVHDGKGCGGRLKECWLTEQHGVN